MYLLSFMIKFLIVLTTAGYILYRFFTRNFNYWKERNVPFLKPVPFFGNYYEIMTCQTTIGSYLAKLYREFKSPYVGIFVLNKPSLVIRSPELLKSILVQDFNYFNDHVVLSDKKCDSLVSEILFVVKNPKWKIIRSKMTAAFTIGKIKGMLGLINEVSLNMSNYIKRHLNNTSIEAKALCSRYSIDIITTCAFGIQACSFENENSEFNVICSKMFQFDLGTAFRQASYFMLPELVKIFRFSFFKRGVTDFCRNVFWETINLREKTNNKRNDLIDILIDMKRHPDHRIDFTGDTVVGQAFTFLIAGHETTSTAMSFTLYELCLSLEIQNKARKEIKSILSQYGSFTYEALQDMKYIDMIIFETLRKYPPLPFLDRICVKDYKLPGSNLIIEKGTPIYIPVFGIHHDPEIYLEPEKFNPERFSEGNKGSLPSFSYLPFGEGPRGCFGVRFGLLVIKLGIAQLLSEYELEMSSDTPTTMEFEIKSFLLKSKTDLSIKFRKISTAV